jgi:hypothetical protein
LDFPRVSRDVKGCLALLVLHVRVRTTLKKYLYNIIAIPKGGGLEGSFRQTTLGVNIRTLVEKESHDLYVSP